MPKLSPLDVLGQSLRLMAAHARPLAWLAVPYLLLQGWSQVLIYEAEMVARIAGEAAGEGAAAFVQPRPIHGLALILAMWVWLALNVNVYRVVLGDRTPETQPWAPLRLGWTEVRLFGMSLALGVMMAGPLLVGVVGGTLVGGSRTAGALVALLVLPWAVFAAVRLWMSLPAIALDRPQAARESWHLTEGQVLPLFVTTALLLVMSLAIAMVLHLPAGMLRGAIGPEGGVALLLLGLLEGAINAVLTVLWLVVAAVCYGRLREMQGTREMRQRGADATKQ